MKNETIEIKGYDLVGYFDNQEIKVIENEDDEILQLKTVDDVNNEDINESELFDDEDEELSFGYHAMGFVGDVNVVFSNYRRLVCELKAKDFNKNSVLNLFGRDYLERYSYINKKGEKAYDLLTLQEEVTNACMLKGIYKDTGVKGGGIYIDPKDSNHLIVNSKKVWGSRKDFDGKRAQGDLVFNIDKDLKFNKNQEKATREEVLRVVEALKTWNFSNGLIDVKILFGWFLCGFFAGILDWRTHISLTAAKGSGKSTLLSFFENMYGKDEFCLTADGESTVSGISQKLLCSPAALLIDESESDGKSTKSLIEMSRSASGGTTVYKGRANHNSIKMERYFSGMFVGIVPLQLQPADLSRFFLMSMKKYDITKQINKDVEDKEFQRDVGRKLLKVMFDNYSKFIKLSKDIDLYLFSKKADGRFRKTTTSILAASMLVLELYDGSEVRDYNENDIIEFIKDFDIQQKMEESESNEEDDLLLDILRINLTSETIKNDIVLNHILAYHDKYDYNISNKVNKSEIKSILGSIGIRTDFELDDIVLYIDCADTKLRKMLKDTKFSSGNLKSVLIRSEELIEFNKEISIGNQKRKRKDLVKLRLNKEMFNNDEDIDDSISCAETVENNKELYEEAIINYVSSENIPF